MPNLTIDIDLSDNDLDNVYVVATAASGKARFDLAPERAQELLAVWQRFMEMKEVDGLDMQSIQVRDGSLTVTSAYITPDNVLVEIDEEDFRWIAREGDKEIDITFPAAEIEDLTVAAGLRLPNDRIVVRTPLVLQEPLTNAYRGSQIDREVRLYAAKTGLDPSMDADGPDTAGGDAIAAILHWVETKTQSKETAVKTAMDGLAAYLTESFDPDPSTPNIGFHIDLEASCEEAGVDVRYCAYKVGIEIDETRMEELRTSLLGDTGPVGP